MFMMMTCIPGSISYTLVYKVHQKCLILVLIRIYIGGSSSRDEQFKYTEELAFRFLWLIGMQFLVAGAIKVPAHGSTRINRGWNYWRAARLKGGKELRPIVKLLGKIVRS